MKKLFLISLILITTTTSLTGCGSSKKEDSNKTNDTISTEENLFNVEVTLPKSFFEDQDIEKIKAEAKKAGVHDIKVHDDGSLTYKMDKSTHKKLLTDLKVTVDEMITETLADKEGFPSFSKIEYNKDLSEFNIFVDSKKFNSFESFAAFGYYMVGNIYQAMNCVETTKIDTIVNFVNKDTKEVIKSGKASELNKDTKK